MNLRSMLDTDKDTDELKIDFLRLKGRMLVFANSHIHLDNISLIEVIDLSTERPIPTYFYIMGLVGLFLLLSGGSTMLLGIAVLGALAFLVYQFWQKRVSERYGLSLVTNSGRSRVLLAQNERFLKDVAAKLCEAINDPKISALVANFNNQKIDIGTMSGGVIATEVDGNINQDNA